MDEMLHASDKMQYLQQAMVKGSEAETLVNGYPSTAENYPKAVEALKDRFGRESLLLQVYVRELLQLVISNVNSAQPPPLELMYGKLTAHLRALSTLNLSSADPATWLFPLVESSLPEEVLRAWQRSGLSRIDGAKEDPKKISLDLLMEFMKGEVQANQQIALARSGFPGSTRETKGGREKEKKPVRGIVEDFPAVAALHTANAGCAFCSKGNHDTADCYGGKKLSLEEKRKKVADARLCFNCLKRGHRAAMCRNPTRCSVCQKQHHVVICPGKEDKSLPQPNVSGTVTEGQGHAVTPVPVTATSYNGSAETVLMKTLCVEVRGPSTLRRVRVLLDDGSQRSYITSSLVRDLRCRKIGEVTMQNCLFGGHVTRKQKRGCYAVSIAGIEGPYSRNCQEVALVDETVITSACPRVACGAWEDDLRRNQVVLTDHHAQSLEIGVLIGSDLWGSLMTGKMKKLENGLLAMETIFGLTVSGELASGSGQVSSTVISMLTQSRNLTDLWSLELLGIRDRAEKINEDERDREFKEEFQKKMVRDKDGRYVVGLPWKDGVKSLPSNSEVAVKRLHVTTKKLSAINQLDRYSEIFKDWETEGIIEMSSDKGQCLERQSYLPHRPVFKPDSQTTPVRPVFDASCRTGGGLSLNDLMETGPNLLEMIPAILLRFRERRIGAVADIRKAFQMIRDRSEDRDAQKFLWWEDPNCKEMVEYRHCRVVFGMSCSPFILAAVLDWHLTHVRKEDQLVARKLLNSIYVDNVAATFDAIGDYQSFRENAVRLIADAGMELRHWESCFEEEKSKTPTIILGLGWDKETDELHCRVKVAADIDSMVVTKRAVLSISASVFDPVGVVCPAMITPRIMLQQAWVQKVAWDEPWDVEASSAFRRWCSEIACLEKMRIKRWVSVKEDPEKMQLHCFVDASKDAYAACVYLKSAQEAGGSIALLAAKSRLAPLSKEGTKRITIPRLELMGCLVGARLVMAVVEGMTVQGVPVTMWSDSATALSWIARRQPWGPFVENRVQEIRKLVPGATWRHVPGQHNPADLPSRGCNPKQLKESRWWEGPDWLRCPEDQWPSSKVTVNEEEVVEEQKKTAVSVTVQREEPRFSSYRKNVRVAAYVRRFIERTRRPSGNREQYTSTLTDSELKLGEQDIWARVQRRHFPGTPKFSNMGVQRGEDGLLHVKTRLPAEGDWDNLQFPVLLPSDDPMVELLIRDAHLSSCHAGAQTVLNNLRERYWILRGRRSVARVITKCKPCRREQVKSYQTIPAPLPVSRVQTVEAFQTTGVDLAGPLYLKGGGKVWIVVYTCAVYRGIHLDWVRSLSTETFLNSLEKFTLTMGRPATVYSDHGTNFVGAVNLLRVLDPEQVQRACEVQNIKWIFNPPGAPWWGGWWERLVRTIKELLRHMLGRAKVGADELSLHLSAVAYVVNSRTLTTVTEDPDDLRPLTPFMFMRSLPVGGMPERDLMSQQDLRRGRQDILTLRQALRARFRKEYLGLLIQRANEKPTFSPQVGDVVLVGFDNKKRYEWPLAKIKKLIKGKDGNVRVAIVKTAAGELVRPLQRLYPLELPTGYAGRDDPAEEEVPVEQTQERLDEADTDVVAEATAARDDVPGSSQEKEDAPQTLTTRRGRPVKRPIRYLTWNG